VSWHIEVDVLGQSTFGAKLSFHRVQS